MIDASPDKLHTFKPRAQRPPGGPPNNPPPPPPPPNLHEQLIDLVDPYRCQGVPSLPDADLDRILDREAAVAKRMIGDREFAIRLGEIRKLQQEAYRRALAMNGGGA